MAGGRGGDDRKDGPQEGDGRSPMPAVVAASEAYRDMFVRLSRLVTRRPVALVVAWIALAAGLKLAPPGWDQVTKDDNVRFFPPDFPSVIGQSCSSAASPGRGELAGRAGLRAHGSAR